jgi:hypothetical protein
VSQTVSGNFCRLFFETVSSYIIQRRIIRDEGWIGKDLEESVHSAVEILSRNLPGGTEECHENCSQDSWSPGINSNRISPGHEPPTLLLREAGLCLELTWIIRTTFARGREHGSRSFKRRTSIKGKFTNISSKRFSRVQLSFSCITGDETWLYGVRF